METFMDMTKNPFINALLAELYIVTIVSAIQYGLAPNEQPGSLLIPIVMLSLFVLSAAIMGYLFLSQPVQLYLEGEKKKAVKLFLQTVIIFGGITAVILIILISGVSL